MKVSVIAAAHRNQWWQVFMDSLKSTEIEYEVIFVGPNPPLHEYENFRYISSEAKPAQCYEIARRSAKGELVHWTADDAEYSENCLDHAYAFWKSLHDRKAVVSIQTHENGSVTALHEHCFFNGRSDTPLMAPVGMMNREYLGELGGLDARYIYGQYENDIVMRVYEDGGSCHKFKIAHIALDHYRKHGGEGRLWETYLQDRSTLEGSWVKDGQVVSKRLDPVVRYPKKMPELSFNNKGMWP
jgi:hypothetical protein